MEDKKTRFVLGILLAVGGVVALSNPSLLNYFVGFGAICLGLYIAIVALISKE